MSLCNPVKSKTKACISFPSRKKKYGMKCNRKFTVKKFTEVQEIHEHWKGARQVISASPLFVFLFSLKFPINDIAQTHSQARQKRKENVLLPKAELHSCQAAKNKLFSPPYYSFSHIHTLLLLLLFVLSCFPFKKKKPCCCCCYSSFCLLLMMAYVTI